MKVIIENVEGEQYLELVLTDFDLDLLDEGKILTKDIQIKKCPFSLGIRKQTIREKNEEYERYS